MKNNFERIALNIDSTQRLNSDYIYRITIKSNSLSINDDKYH